MPGGGRALLFQGGAKAGYAWNHRIIECLELEGTLNGHPVQLPCSAQGHHS